MTRGKIAVITNNSIRCSGEYNGDMHIYNWGEDVLDGLKKVKTKKDYHGFIEKFDHRYYGSVPKGLIPPMERFEKSDEIFDCANNYGLWGYSDYLYIKNIGDDAVCFTVKNGTVTLDPGGILILYFGEFDDECESHSSGFKFKKS